MTPLRDDHYQRIRDEVDPELPRFVLVRYPRGGSR